MAYYEERGAPPLGELDNATQLATLLAHEAAEGADSFYHPYIAALPSAAPNGWALGDAAMDAALAALAAGAGAGHAGQLEEWAAEARRTRATLEAHCDALHQRHAKYFRSEVAPAHPPPLTSPWCCTRDVKPSGRNIFTGPSSQAVATTWFRSTARGFGAPARANSQSS